MSVYGDRAANPIDMCTSVLYPVNLTITIYLVTIQCIKATPTSFTIPPTTFPETIDGDTAICKGKLIHISMPRMHDFHYCGHDHKAGLKECTCLPEEI